MGASELPRPGDVPATDRRSDGAMLARGILQASFAIADRCAHRVDERRARFHRRDRDRVRRRIVDRPVEHPVGCDDRCGTATRDGIFVGTGRRFDGLYLRGRGVLGGIAVQQALDRAAQVVHVGDVLLVDIGDSDTAMRLDLDDAIAAQLEQCFAYRVLADAVVSRELVEGHPGTQWPDAFDDIRSDALAQPGIGRRVDGRFRSRSWTGGYGGRSIHMLDFIKW